MLHSLNAQQINACCASPINDEQVFLRLWGTKDFLALRAPFPPENKNVVICGHSQAWVRRLKPVRECEPLLSIKLVKTIPKAVTFYATKMFTFQSNAFSSYCK